MFREASHFNVNADLSLSHGSYLYDLNSCSEVLDLFGMYSSLPLGYWHPAFRTDEYLRDVSVYAGVKVANCEVGTPAADAFYRKFTNFGINRMFTNFHFTTTGANAIEAACKVALLTKMHGEIGVFRSSYHGIYGYAALLASSTGPAASRLEGLFAKAGIVFDDPTDANRAQVLAGIEERLKYGSLAGMLVEPIQCTAGDRVLSPFFLSELRGLCTKYRVPLIFDEIQTGFGATGTLWYFQQLSVVPDIVVFGKKTQLSGIMALDSIRVPSAPLAATWDGDVLDMLRCHAIMDAYEREDIPKNIFARGLQFEALLPGLRRVGLLMAMDFSDATERDAFVRSAWLRHVMVIPTGDKVVRLRPNLAITEAEVDDACARLRLAWEDSH